MLASQWNRLPYGKVMKRCVTLPEFTPVLTEHVAVMFQSGYRVEFMPHWAPHHAPDPTQDKYSTLSCEALFVTTMYWPPKYRNVNGKLEQVDYGGEYLITWFLGRIAEDAVCHCAT